MSSSASAKRACRLSIGAETLHSAHSSLYIHANIVQYAIERWSIGIDKKYEDIFLFVIGNLEGIGYNVPSIHGSSQMRRCAIL